MQTVLRKTKGNSMKIETIFQVTKVEPFSGEIVEFERHDTHIRHSADNWEWCVGESKETVFDCAELEDAYQNYMRLQNV